MLYGRGVFTTLAIYDSKPFCWPNHWERLSAHAEKLDIDLSGCTQKTVGEALRKLIAVNTVQNGRARVIFLARSGRESWRTKSPGTKKTDLLIMTGDVHPVPRDGLSLAVSPYRINTSSPLSGIKTLNYLDRILSREEEVQFVAGKLRILRPLLLIAQFRPLDDPRKFRQRVVLVERREERENARQ